MPQLQWQLSQTTVAVRVRMNDYIQHKAMDVLTYPCPNLMSVLVKKKRGGGGYRFLRPRGPLHGKVSSWYFLAVALFSHDDVIQYEHVQITIKSLI